MRRFEEFLTSEVMSKPQCVSPDAALADVERMIGQAGYNGIPVVEDGRLVGVVTSLDLLGAFVGSSADVSPPFEDVMRRPVSSIMVAGAEHVAPATPLTEVALRMLGTRNKSFPVVDPESGRVVGVVAREDLMRAVRSARLGREPGDVEQD